VNNAPPSVKIERSSQNLGPTELAEKLKMPTAMRAIGAAIGKNPLLIFIPDHRVLNRSGTSGGFAGIALIRPEVGEHGSGHQP
jgi:O-6-methylguanine DNA methyltransferase